jgi:hypothetical protein
MMAGHTSAQTEASQLLSHPAGLLQLGYPVGAGPGTRREPEGAQGASTAAGHRAGRSGHTGRDAFAATLTTTWPAVRKEDALRNSEHEQGQSERNIEFTR